MALTKKQRELCAKILDEVYTNGAISRIDIANKTNITPATVSSLTSQMVEEGLLYEAGETFDKKNKAGRKKILLSICHDHSYFIGSEISERYYTFSLTDNLGKIIAQTAYPLVNNEIHLTSEYFISKLQEFLLASPVSIKAIGIALPGHFNYIKADQIVTNNPLWQNFSLATIKDAFDLPVFFSNNVNCMALSEKLYSPDKEDNFLFFNLARGIYCSYVYCGEIFCKQNFLVGEIGHTSVSLQGDLCECGKRGCLQTYASETWLLKKAALLFESSTTTFLRQLATSPKDITLRTLLTAYRLGDSGVILLIDTAINYIALSLLNMTMILDSSKVFIRGKLFSEPMIKKQLLSLLNYESSLSSMTSANQFIVKNFDIYTGSIGATALALNRTLLNKL